MKTDMLSYPQCMKNSLNSMRSILCFLSIILFISLLPAWGVDDSLIVFVAQAKLRDNPEFSARVIATVPEDSTLAWTGKIYRAKSGEDHFGIINESWVQVDYEDSLLWVPRRDCLTPVQYQLISAAHKAGIAGDAKAMIVGLDEAGTLVVSSDGKNAFADYDPELVGVFRAGRGLVEWFEIDTTPNALWSPDSRYVVLSVPNGIRSIYDMQKGKAYFAGAYEYRLRQFTEVFVPGYYLYSAPGDELHGVKGEKAYEIYYQPQVWAVNLESGEDFLLLAGRMGSLEMHGGAWSMEMEVKAKDVPDAIKATEMWEQYAGGMMVCPMMYGPGGMRQRQC